MKLPDFRKDSQTTGINGIGIAGNILLAGIVFGQISAFWLFAAIPLVLVGFTAESRLVNK